MKIGNLKAALMVLEFAIGCGAFAQTDTISFATKESADRASWLLREKGIRVFMNEVWRHGVDAPGIHSKYWLDQFTRDNLKLAQLEKAYRDFGYEVAVQIEKLAFEIYENPDRGQEKERLDWLLRFSKWIMKPGRFENFRIGMRVEDAATMPLHRMAFSLDVSTDVIESYVSKFTTARECAIIRANILFEESNGVLDVRGLAKNVVEGKDDGFEAVWISQARDAYKHFGNHMPEYTLDPEILMNEEIKYSFFADDNTCLWGQNCIPNRWNRKCHKAVCVFTWPVRYLNLLTNILTFRKDVGEFPDVDVPPGEDARHAYESCCFKKYNWEHKLTTADAKSVAAAYLDYKNNTYMDSSTFYSSRTKGNKGVSLDQYETWQSTKIRRVKNQQWLEKQGKDDIK